MQQESSITYQGTKYSFKCSEDSWNFYKGIIKAWCDGETLEYDAGESWADCEELFEPYLKYYRIKPKEVSKSYPNVGEVWHCEDLGHFVICKDTDKTGQVFWLEHNKISLCGFTYKQIVFDNYCTKAYDCLEDYFTANEEK